MISISRLGWLPVLAILTRRRIWDSRSRGGVVGSFLCRNFPGCFSVGSLNVIITLSCGIPLGNPKEIIKSAHFCNVFKVKKKHTIRWGDGEALHSARSRSEMQWGLEGLPWLKMVFFYDKRCGVSTLWECGGKNGRRKRKSQERSKRLG